MWTTTPVHLKCGQIGMRRRNHEANHRVVASTTCLQCTREFRVYASDFNWLRVSTTGVDRQAARAEYLRRAGVAGILWFAVLLGQLRGVASIEKGVG